MTITEARQQIERAQAEAPAALVRSLDQLGVASVDRLAAESPRATGEFASGWFWAPPVLGNSAPHAPYVHDGVAFEMVPQTLDALQPAFEAVLTTEIDAAVGWK